MRDDFSPLTKQNIAQRVNYICSNPTCNTPTTKPNPANEEKSINLGVASHITAASPKGPRFDPNLTQAQRQSASNGIWLCQKCAHEVDTGQEAYSVNLLNLWKNKAESAAARNTSTTKDKIQELINDIDSTVKQIHEIVEDFSTKDAQINHFSTNFNASEEERHRTWIESTKKSIMLSTQRRNAYNRIVAPAVAKILANATIYLGEEDPNVTTIKHESIGAPTNYFTMNDMVTALIGLKESLAYR